MLPDRSQAPPDRSGAPAPILNHRIASHAALEALSASASLPLRFRTIGREAPQIDLQGLRTANLCVWTVDSSTGFESMPTCDVDVFSIRIPLRGGMLRRTQTQDHAMLPGEATIFAASEILATRFEPGARILNCSITADLLRQRHRMFDDADDAPLLLTPRADNSRLPTRALVHTLQQFAAAASRDAKGLMSPLLEDLLMNQVLTAWPLAPRGAAVALAGHGQVRALKRAIDFIEAHLGDPLTVSMVAAAAGVSVRTLQLVFQSQTGRTPLGYILERRLECTHADLRANDGRLRVSQIAYRWGFLHMGEFARRYRLRYGCPPSQTNRHTP